MVMRGVGWGSSLASHFGRMPGDINIAGVFLFPFLFPFLGENYWLLMGGYICVFKCIHVYMCVYMCIYVYICVHVCIYVYICV